MDIIASWILKYFLRVEKKKNQVCVKESEDSFLIDVKLRLSLSSISELKSHKRLEKGGNSSSILSISKIVMMPSVLVIWQQKIFKNYHHDFSSSKGNDRSKTIQEKSRMLQYTIFSTST